MIDPAEDRITAKVFHTHPALIQIFLQPMTETSSLEYNITLFVPLDIIMDIMKRIIQTKKVQ
jgi:hypothetical protein